MDDIKDSSVDPVVPKEGKKAPPEAVELSNDDKNNEINKLIQSQMKTLQDNLMTQFDGQFKEKISKLENDKKEIEEKKQNLVVSEALRSSNMDSSLIDFVYDKDIEVTKIKINQLKDLIAIEVEKGIEERLRKNSYIPPSNNSIKSSDSDNYPKYFV